MNEVLTLIKLQIRLKIVYSLSWGILRLVGFMAFQPLLGYFMLLGGWLVFMAYQLL